MKALVFKPTPTNNVVLHILLENLISYEVELPIQFNGKLGVELNKKPISYKCDIYDGGLGIVNFDYGDLKGTGRFPVTLLSEQKNPYVLKMDVDLLSVTTSVIDTPETMKRQAIWADTLLCIAVENPLGFTTTENYHCDIEKDASLKARFAASKRGEFNLDEFYTIVRKYLNSRYEAKTLSVKIHADDVNCRVLEQSKQSDILNYGYVAFNEIKYPVLGLSSIQCKKVEMPSLTSDDQMYLQAQTGLTLEQLIDSDNESPFAALRDFFRRWSYAGIQESLQSDNNPEQIPMEETLMSDNSDLEKATAEAEEKVQLGIFEDNLQAIREGEIKRLKMLEFLKNTNSKEVLQMLAGLLREDDPKRNCKIKTGSISGASAVTDDFYNFMMGVCHNRAEHKLGVKVTADEPSPQTSYMKKPPMTNPSSWGYSKKNKMLSIFVHKDSFNSGDDKVKELHGNLLDIELPFKAFFGLGNLTPTITFHPDGRTALIVPIIEVIERGDYYLINADWSEGSLTSTDKHFDKQLIKRIEKKLIRSSSFSPNSAAKFLRELDESEASDICKRINDVCETLSDKSDEDTPSKESEEEINETFPEFCQRAYLFPRWNAPKASVSLGEQDGSNEDKHEPSFTLISWDEVEMVDLPQTFQSASASMFRLPKDFITEEQRITLTNALKDLAKAIDLKVKVPDGDRESAAITSYDKPLVSKVPEVEQGNTSKGKSSKLVFLRDGTRTDVLSKENWTPMNSDLGEHETDVLHDSLSIDSFVVNMNIGANVPHFVKVSCATQQVASMFINTLGRTNHRSLDSMMYFYICGDDLVKSDEMSSQLNAQIKKTLGVPNDGKWFFHISITATGEADLSTSVCQVNQVEIQTLGIYKHTGIGLVNITYEDSANALISQLKFLPAGCNLNVTRTRYKPVVSNAAQESVPKEPINNGNLTIMTDDYEFIKRACESGVHVNDNPIPITVVAKRMADMIIARLLPTYSNLVQHTTRLRALPDSRLQLQQQAAALNAVLKKAKLCNIHEDEEPLVIRPTERLSQLNQANEEVNILLNRIHEYMTVGYHETIRHVNKYSHLFARDFTVNEVLRYMAIPEPKTEVGALVKELFDAAFDVSWVPYHYISAVRATEPFVK